MKHLCFTVTHNNTVMRKLLFVFILLSINYSGFSQFPGMGGNRGSAAGQNMNVGRFYGKLVDAANKGVEGATVQLIGNRFDTVTKRMKEAILSTQLSDKQGEFSIENLSLFGNFKLKVSSLGFKTLEKQIKFDIKMPAGGPQALAQNGGFQQLLGQADKDLGNIKLEEDPSTLTNVTVTTTAKQFFEMGVDRKIFNVEKNINSTGQTAVEIMRNIPSLNVDIDGNVTLRNAAPQLFIDGRPTTLTLEQIPADIVEKVELITNPSAKFDASGGNAGILNVVLKKNKKVGYNGGLRYGLDSRWRSNIGGDLNLRQNKFNFFLSGNFNQRKSISTALTDRDNFGTSSKAIVLQNSNATNSGYFAFLRGGMDYFIDNRNTITVSGSFVNGLFNNEEGQRIDSSINSIFTSYSLRDAYSNAEFRNVGASFSFKHNFPKAGHEWTADVNYNKSNNDNNSDFTQTTYFPNSFSIKGNPVLQKTLGTGSNSFVIIQTDYENPITDNTKFEAGARAQLRDFTSNNVQQFFNYNTNTFQTIPSISANFAYNDAVYAAYSIYSFKKKNWSYQLGMRAESSFYDGRILGKDSSFRVDFPISLFPSAFITYKKSDKEDIQVNYSRRINRPNFFQLIPFIDYTDPQNLNVGNAGLKPEFVNSLELSYNNAYKKGANLLINAFFKYSTNLITRYQYKGTDPLKPFDSVVFNTFTNANNSIIYGIEITNRMDVNKWWNMTANLNIFNSQINGENIAANLNNQLVSWFAKLNNNFKLKKGYSIQLSGDYQAKTVLPPGGGGGGFGGGRGGFGGGMMFGGGNVGTAQGFNLPRYAVDLSIRKDFTWKGGNTGSLTLSMNDIFRTQLQQTYAESPFFTQTFQRRRDPQVLRLNFSWRFGKFDPNLFKRKSTKGDMDGGAGSMMGGMNG